MADAPITTFVCTIPDDYAPEWEYLPVDDDAHACAEDHDDGEGTGLGTDAGPDRPDRVADVPGRGSGVDDGVHAGSDAGLHGLPAAIGVDTPLTWRSEYLGQLRDGRVPPIVAEIIGAPADTTDDADADDPPPAKPLDLPAVLPIGQQPFEYLCGTAGSGKTTLARALIDRAPAGSVVLAATTGIAAVNLGEGTTINALLGYFNLADLREKYLNGTLHTTLRRRWRAGMRRIVLDEVSMLSGQALTYLVRAIQETNTRPASDELSEVGLDDDVAAASESSAAKPRITDDPIGLTLVGDFGQLPPVPDDEEYRDKDGKRAWRKLPVTFAFESPEWPVFAPHVTKLTKIWRQDAQDFIQALRAVRMGDRAGALSFFHEGRFSLATDDTFDGTTIFAKNTEVDRYNQIRLDALSTPVLMWPTIRQGTQRHDWKQIPDLVVVKESALVMLLANRREYDDDADTMGHLIYANGDLGHVEGKDQSGTWRVRLHRGFSAPVLPVTRENTIPLEPGRKKELVEQYGEGSGRGVRDGWRAYVTEDGKSEIIGRITYMPLRVAYGCTVHKTQGLTLDAVQVNIRDHFFKQPGMLFVALSRARTAEGLRLIGSPRGFLERCTVDARVTPWL